MQRTLLVLRFILAVVAYGSTCAAFTLGLGQAMHGYGVGAVLGAKASLAMFLIPNAIVFAVFIWLLRERWRTLRSPQILAVSVLAAAATLAIAVLSAVLFSSFLEQSELAADLAAKITMVVPGALAAQLLRVGGRHAHIPAANER